MKALFGLSFLSSALVSVLALAIDLDIDLDIGPTNSSYTPTCQTIESSISSASGIYYIG